jgi:hypothetical protein
MLVPVDTDNITAAFMFREQRQSRYFLLVSNTGIVEFIGQGYDCARVYEQRKVDDDHHSYRLQLRDGVKLLEVTPIGDCDYEGDYRYLKAETIEHIITAMDDLFDNEIRSTSVKPMHIADIAILAAAVEYFPKDVFEIIARTIEQYSIKNTVNVVRRQITEYVELLKEVTEHLDDSAATIIEPHNKAKIIEMLTPAKLASIPGSNDSLELDWLAGRMGGLALRNKSDNPVSFDYTNVTDKPKEPATNHSQQILVLDTSQLAKIKHEFDTQPGLTYEECTYTLPYSPNDQTKFSVPSFHFPTIENHNLAIAVLRRTGCTGYTTL